MADYDDEQEAVDVDGLDGLSAQELAAVQVNPEPLSAQQLAESECNRWASEWREGKPRLEPQWDAFKDEQLPEPILLEALKDACMSLQKVVELLEDFLHVMRRTLGLQQWE